MAATRTHRACWLFTILFWLAFLLWLISYLNVHWAPGTRRHLFSLSGGVLAVNRVRSSVFYGNSGGKAAQSGQFPINSPPLAIVDWSGTWVPGSNNATLVWVNPGFEVFGFGRMHTNWLGLGYQASRGVDTLSFPLWMPSTLFLACALFFHWRTQRRKANFTLCACGYDLRELSSQVCPECGTPIPDAQRQAISSMQAQGD